MEQKHIKTNYSVNYDGWSNFFTGIGTGVDKVASSTFDLSPQLSPEFLTNLYRNSAFARKVVDIPAGDMLREWVEVEGDSEGFVLKELTGIKAKEKFRDLVKWARLYGGAVMVIGADDGLDLSEPLNEDGVRAVRFLRVYDRHQVTWMETDLDNNPLNASFGMPEIYTITPYTVAGDFRVHHSRVIRMNGANLPEREAQRNQGWGDSELQSTYESLKQLGLSYSGTANIIQDFAQTILQIDNLSSMIATGQEDLVKKRLAIIDMSRSVLNTVILDKEEQFSKQSSSVAGISDLIDRFQSAVSAATGIPVTRFFGTSPGGLNATGESDIRNYYDDLKSEQEENLFEPLTRIVKLIAVSRENSIKLNPDDLNVVFNPLWQMSDREEAEWRKLVAETDDIYLRNAVVDPSEVAISRFGGEHYSMETEIYEGLRDVETEDRAQTGANGQEGIEKEASQMAKPGQRGA